MEVKTEFGERIARRLLTLREKLLEAAMEAESLAEDLTSAVSKVEPAVRTGRKRTRTKLRVSVDGQVVSAQTPGTSSADALVQGLEMILAAGLRGAEAAVRSLPGVYPAYVSTDTTTLPSSRRRKRLDEVADTGVIVSATTQNELKLEILKWVQGQLAAPDADRVRVSLERDRGGGVGE